MASYYVKLEVQSFRELLDKLDLYKRGLERLASMEAFYMSTTANVPEEVKHRIEYARNVLQMGENY